MVVQIFQSDESFALFYFGSALCGGMLALYKDRPIIIFLTAAGGAFGVFVGICYVGFTENESAKRTLNKEGDEESIPSRPAFLTASRQKTARKMLKQIKRRKYAVNQSGLGRMVMLLSNWLPGLTLWIMKANYKPPHS